MPTDSFLSTILQDPNPLYGRRAEVIKNLRGGIFVRRTDTTAGVITPQASLTLLGFDPLPQRRPRGGWRHPLPRDFRLAIHATRTWGWGRTSSIWPSSLWPSSTSSEEPQKRRSLVLYGLRKPFGVHALLRRYMEGEIDSNAFSVEVSMTNSTTSKVRERSKLRLVTLVVGSIRGGGTRAMGRMFRGRRRAKDRLLLVSKPEPKKRRGDIASIVRSLILSLSR